MKAALFKFSSARRPGKIAHKLEYANAVLLRKKNLMRSGCKIANGLECAILGCSTQIFQYMVAMKNCMQTGI